jgi:hypothetical protein
MAGLGWWSYLEDISTPKSNGAGLDIRDACRLNGNKECRFARPAFDCKDCEISDEETVTPRM